MNRVVGRGRTVKVDLQLTDQCGWGVYAAKDGPKVPKGSFIAIYSGELLTIAEGMARDAFYLKLPKPRSYLFDLDFRCVGEVIGVQQFESEGLVVLEHCSTDRTPIESTTTNHENSAASGISEPKAGDEKVDSGFNGLYTVDAWHYGNLSRFINHCCVPNVQLRCCYIDEGDDAKPLLAMFTISDIKPGEQIFINYSGVLPPDSDLDSADMPPEIESKNRTPRKGDKDGKSRRRRETGTARQPGKAKSSVTIARKDDDRENDCYCGHRLCTGVMFPSGEGDK